MKLLIDMNLSPRWVSFFAASQVEAVHWSSVGAVNATDLEIMATRGSTVASCSHKI